jgi:alpha,alpha-trehalase
MRRRPAFAALPGLLLLVATCAGPVRLPPQAALDDLQRYISTSWTTLTRSSRDLAKAAPDAKIDHRPGAPWPVYVARSESLERVQRELAEAMSADDLRAIELRRLPPDQTAILEHGLLYLPRPYVVPGGRFNEMYGWDSYFIQVGLLHDDELSRARDLAENFLYEVEHYGAVLNANRTYYLTRSQPPLLTRMVLGVFERTRDLAWLRAARPAIERYYRYWTSEPHLIPVLGLSRYFDLGEGPAPEVLTGERDESGRSHYDRVREFYRTHTVSDYDVRRFYDANADQLTALFYKGDRSMRESGFDPSNRFGPFSADIIHYAPVCLNALLHQMEIDAATIASLAGDNAEETRWRDRARERRERIDRYLWDGEAGLYDDYNFETGRRRSYPFATTFYPLWVGAASREQAERVRGNLPRFEAPGGLLTGTVVTGSQWDAPFGWAPLQMIAVAGLRRYGYREEADRLAIKFVSMVASDFQRSGTIVEKYDVRRRRSDVAGDLAFGYRSNEVGFGWTNAAVLDLLAGLRQARPAAGERSSRLRPVGVFPILARRPYTADGTPKQAAGTETRQMVNGRPRS